MNKKKAKIDESQLPDGGWGWLVVLGVALTNMFNQSLISVFGLLFGQELERMGHDTAGIALVSNISNMVTCFSGLIMGPVLKTYSCRKVTLCGAILTSSGLILTSFATTLYEVIVFYSIFSAIGLGLMYPATFVAIKSYFSTKQGRAVGLSMAGTGVGQMLMPQVVRYLLDEVGYRWTTRIIGALCLHGVAGALLFQPVRWHLKKSTSRELLQVITKVTTDGTTNLIVERNNEVAVKQLSVEVEPKQSIWRKICALLDLNLLKDPIFININVGLGLAYTAGVVFGMLFPFFLMDDIGLSRKDTALCMSLLSAMDIIARVTLPSLTHFMKISSRTTFLFGALALAVARSVIAEQSTRTAMIVASLFCGYIRAATIINQNLSCSDYCTDEQLPAALGLVMVSKGLIVMTVGQILGWYRDYSESYALCIHATNSLLVIVFVTWGIEQLLTKMKKR